MSLSAGAGFDAMSPIEVRTETSSGGNVTGRGGDVVITSNLGPIPLLRVNASTRAGNGNVPGSGSIRIDANAGAIQFTGSSALDASARADAGSVTAATGSLMLEALTGIGSPSDWTNASSSSLVGTASFATGPIAAITTSGSIEIANLVNSSTAPGGSGPGGGVMLTANAGLITVGNIESRSLAGAAGAPAARGGNVQLGAAGPITTGMIRVDSFAGAGGASAGAGDIAAVTPNTIQAGLLSANSTAAAGQIALDGGRVRAIADVEAIGLPGSGSIMVTHDGNALVPFIVGDATLNGSTGVLRTTDASIEPVRSFLYSHLEWPNIRIVSIEQQIAGLGATSTSPTTLGQATQFEASVSQGSSVLYVWDFGDGSDPAYGPTVAHTYAAAGEFTVRVTASNPLNSVDTTLQANVTNDAPIANAGPDQTLEGGVTAVLDGSGSTDPDGHLPLAYAWAQVSGPVVALGGPTSAVASFTVPTGPAELRFTLGVTDSRGLAGATTDEVVITVPAPRYLVGGTVSGLLGSGLVLQNNAGDDLAISADGAFAFATRLLEGDTFAVTVAAQPQSPGQQCTIVNGSGTVTPPGIDSVAVVCRALTTIALDVASPAPVRADTATSYSASVSGTSGPPFDGEVAFSASTGESCLAADPSVGASQSTFACELTFTTLGPRTISASFANSTTHMDAGPASATQAVMRFADLSVVVDDGFDEVQPGAEVAWTIDWHNGGPDDAPASTISASVLPALEDAGWSCVASDGATCPAANGSGEIDATVDLPAGGALAFVFEGRLPATLPPSVVLGAAITADPLAPNYVSDQDQSNNAADDSNGVVPIFADGFEP